MLTFPGWNALWTIWDNMVHYGQSQMLIPKPPSICPKCGSHRTEIVGFTDDGRRVVVRCNACGARSELTAPGTEPPAAPAIFRNLSSGHRRGPQG